MEKNERVARRQLRKVKALTALAIIAIIGIVVIFGLKSPAFNVDEVKVSGNHYYTDDEIINMADCTEGANIFTGIDCGDIRDRLMKDPYMSQVKVKRKLPSTIEIDINERRQVAGVVYGTSYVVIDSEAGIVLPSEEDVAATAEKTELTKRLLNAITALGEPDATILIHKFFYDRNSVQIARSLGMNPITVRSRCTRALKRLRSSLSDLDGKE